MGTLAFVKKQAEKTGENGQTAKTAGNKEKMLAFILEHKTASSSEIADYTHLSPSRVRFLLSELTEEGKVIPEGRGRTRRYRTEKNDS
ncbi:MAG: winged helix-turn-helix domain-containing protein [Oscillospiraceae bacterium]|nr:winged helix-turn-helix domain-containing protein [Oscillospiraceae bacterium]